MKNSFSLIETSRQKLIFIISVLVYILNLIPNANAAYSEQQTRYLSGYDFQFKVYQIFNDNLSQMDEQQINRIQLSCSPQSKDWGFISTISGQALKTEPTLNTANLIQNCFNLLFNQINEQIQNEFKKSILITKDLDSTTNIKLIQNEKQKLSFKLVTLLNPLFSDSMILNNSNHLNSFQQGDFIIFKSVSELTQEQKMELISYLVNQFLGDDQNIISFQIIKDPLAYKKYLLSQLKPHFSIFENIRQIVKILILRDEFLKY